MRLVAAWDEYQGGREMRVVRIDGRGVICTGSIRISYEYLGDLEASLSEYEIDLGLDQ